MNSNITLFCSILPSPHTHRYSHNSVFFSSGPLWLCFHSLHVLCVFLPSFLALTFHLSEMIFPLLSCFTDSVHLSHFFRTYTPTKFFLVCGTNQRRSHGDFWTNIQMYIPKATLFFGGGRLLFWRFYCSWLKIVLRMWLKLSWSIYIQNIISLINYPS